MASLLIVDDEKAIRKQLMWQLTDMFSVYEAENVDQAKQICSKTSIDIILIDLHLPPDLTSPRSGKDMLSYIRIQHPGIIPIIMTGLADPALSLNVIDMGAWDVFTKPINPDELTIVMKRALRLRDLSNELEIFKTNRVAATSDSIIGQSEEINQLREMISQVAPTDASVLITGESGTGKELVAEAIHRQSLRSKKPFIAVNCAALSDSLIEDELFGHESGAYTGSKGPRKGKFELADNGTIFLDEVAELSPAAQAKLLRVLQEGTLERLGSERSIKVDVRVIAATHQNLPDRVAKGNFREDLYYRLSVIPIEVPRLADRGDDIVILSQHFLTHFQKRLNRDALRFHDDAIRLMRAYAWPGNVRELKNMVERITILSKSKVIESQDLPKELRNGEAMPAKSHPPKESALLQEGVSYEAAVNEYRKALLIRALDVHKSKSKAAQALGINRSYLYELLEKLDISFT
jgi:DNA-binding NtrC family response regulator